MIFAYGVGELKVLLTTAAKGVDKKLVAKLGWTRFGFTSDGYGLLTKNKTIGDYITQLKYDIKNHPTRSSLIIAWDNICNITAITSPKQVDNFKNLYTNLNSVWNLYKESKEFYEDFKYIKSSLSPVEISDELKVFEQLLKYEQ